MGYNGFGRLTGNETGGLGNLNFDVGWGRLFGHSMGADIAWLLPAAVICLGAIAVLTRRAPRTDLTRAAGVIWGGWLVVTAVVFSFMNGIVHPYYTVALAPAIAACIGIGATLLWQNRSSLPCATALAGVVAVSLDPGVRAVGPYRRVAAVAAGDRRRRRSGSGGAAARVGPAERSRGAIRRRPGGRGVPGGPFGVFRRDGGHAAQRGDSVGGPVARRCDAASARAAC